MDGAGMHANGADRAPETVVVRAPGRVNLIGDHTDYQDGLCLPAAIDREVVVTLRLRRDGRVFARSDAFAGTVELLAGVDVPMSSVEPAWGRPLAAVLSVLREAQPAGSGRPTGGFDADLTSTVPVGSGLSSSAAFAVALVLAVTASAGVEVPGREVVAMAREAEQRATGVPCGVMDQMASVFGRAGHALLLDCRTLDVVPVALPTGAAILVVHTGVARRLADSAYAERRAACAHAAERAGVAMLRDATLDEVAGDPIARHVVSENARVLAYVEALRSGDLEACGQLMLASHASLRDDFRVSTLELDALVAALVQEGAYGARLTGAGFGGCAVALAPAARVEAVAARAAARYRAATGRVPMPFVVRAADGAGRTT